MWKDFFFFSKGERNGILVLICLIGIVFVANFLLSGFGGEEVMDMSAYRTEVEAFKASLERDEITYSHSKEINRKELFYFDPNKLDSAGFVQLGISPYVVSRILKYRSKGGNFRKPEDFSRIYGMKEVWYTELLPYIRIENQTKNTDFQKNKEKTGVFPEKRKAGNNETKHSAQISIMELNSADTTALKKLKGVGSVYAGRIVKYREWLGGFSRPEQLKEVYGVTDELFLSLKPYLTVDNSLIRKIRLNSGDLNTKLKHPYLKKGQLTAWISFRQKKQTIHSFEELREPSVFSDEEWEQLLPYLSLE
jgi:DNA uptake protein ComE-like DNA-binding protein